MVNAAMPSPQNGGSLIHKIFVFISVLFLEVGLFVLHFVSWERTLINGRPGTPIVDLTNGWGVEVIGDLTVEQCIVALVALATLMIPAAIYYIILKLEAFDRFDSESHVHAAFAGLGAFFILIVVCLEYISFNGLVTGFDQGSFMASSQTASVSGFKAVVLTLGLVVAAQLAAMIAAFGAYNLTK